jgi:hypothetical protein
VPCSGCHKPQRAAPGTLRFGACKDCHADPHAGQFAQRAGGDACEKCHDVDGYLPPTFTVERHGTTAYPLTGAHLAVPCNACHKRPAPDLPVAEVRFKFASTRCADCHADPHRGEFASLVQKSGCEACHAIDAWRTVHYDHDATRFPLTGKHAATPCLGCHKPLAPDAPPGAIRVRDLSTTCQACHRDPHAGQFAAVASSATNVTNETSATEPLAGGGPADGSGATDCARCHRDASAWRADGFDHDRDARFKLEGAHARTPCARCHPRVGAGDEAFVRYKPIEQTCASCHKTGPAQPGGPAGRGSAGGEGK